MDNNQAATQPNAQDVYVPEIFNLYVYFNPKSLQEDTSISVNMVRGNLSLDFTQKEVDGTIYKISKKIPLTHVYNFGKWLETLIGKRINDFGATRTYAKVDKCEYDTVWYDKNTKQYVSSGEIFFNTRTVNGVERFAINASDTKGKIISVVLYDESTVRCFAQTNEYAVIDSSDINLYHFGMLLRDAPTTSVLLTYAIGDKIMQGLRRAFPAAFPPHRNAPNKKPWVDFKNKFKNNNQNQGMYNRPQAIQNTSGSQDSGEDLFNF